MISLATMRIKDAKLDVHLGVVGSHCNDPQSIEFIHRERLDFVVCAASFVPTVKIASAQARIREFYGKHRFYLRNF
jgi:phosphoenolpyruvate synthase/pyruvate phosphate dikinase